MRMNHTLAPQQESALDYFPGGVPPYAIFLIHLEAVRELLLARHRALTSVVEQLAFVGLVAYFEAFCKDQFATILNLVPGRSEALRKRGRDIGVDVTDLLGLNDPLQAKFGFLLSERFNFGTAQRINALYHDLLTVTPFSKSEARTYDKIVNTRNLLVHHGGVLTSKFSNGKSRDTGERAYFDSVVVSKRPV